MTIAVPRQYVVIHKFRTNTRKLLMLLTVYVAMRHPIRHKYSAADAVFGQLQSTVYFEEIYMSTIICLAF